jgi:uncharacterized membrane protein (GlpM family)
MNPFIILAKQLDRLERERTEVPQRKPHYGGMWLGLPVAFALAGLSIKSGQHGLDTAGPIALWAGFVLVVTVFVFACLIYQNRVPIKTQLVVDLIAWSVMAWMFFHFRFWDS